MNDEKLFAAQALKRKVDDAENNIKFSGKIYVYKKTVSQNMRFMPVSESTMKAVRLLVESDLQSQLDDLKAQYEAL